jgi:hypothetical protein
MILKRDYLNKEISYIKSDKEKEEKEKDEKGEVVKKKKKIKKENDGK